MSLTRSAKLKIKIFLPFIVAMILIAIIASLFIRTYPSNAPLSRQPLNFDKEAIKERVEIVSSLTSYEKIGWVAGKLRSSGLNVFKVRGSSTGIVGVSEGSSQKRSPVLIVARLSGFKIDSPVVALVSTLAEAVSGQEHQKDVIFSVTYDEVQQVKEDIARRYGTVPDVIALDLLGTDLRKLNVGSFGNGELPLWAVGMLKRAFAQQGVQDIAITESISELQSERTGFILSTVPDMRSDLNVSSFARTMGLALERLVLTLDEQEMKPVEKPYLPLPFSTYLPYGIVWLILLALTAPFFARSVELMMKVKWTKLSVLWRKKSIGDSLIWVSLCAAVIFISSLFIAKVGLKQLTLFPLGWSFAFMALSRRNAGGIRNFPKGYRMLMLNSANSILCIFLAIAFLSKPLSMIPLLPTLYLWLFISATRRGRGTGQLILLMTGIAALLLLRPDRGWGSLTPFMLTAILFYAISVWRMATAREGAKKRIAVLKETELFDYADQITPKVAVR